MKKISFLVILCFFCFAAFSQNEKTFAHNREIYKAIETGDISKIKDYIDKDAVDHGGGAGGQDVSGGDSIIVMIGGIHKSFTDLKMEVIAEAMNGDYLFTLVRLTGTTTATPGMGLPPNKKMDSKSVDVVKLKNGKAIEHWEYMDPNEMMAMMGSNK